MLRLVQGDVGSGKTVVAALAALRTVEAGHQAALMAPTELLAEQHLRNLSRWLEPLGVAVVGLSGRQRAAERREVLGALQSGSAQVACGTHALFQQGVDFASLGLVIVDEQHRFGVHQRLALHDKGARDGRAPHQLVMTATPIPRTLAMTAYADLDLSVIDELPPGRTPVRTVTVSDARRDEVVTRVRDACRAGRQVYWVCTLIEESEALQCQAAEDAAALLAEALPGLRVDLVHGRQRPAEKEAAMRQFKAGETDLLVATTVIEVGVDVPNASLMVIENAERLGLAQLHQLRGRVGRGSAESHCVLLYHAPLGDAARERLAILRETTDGFAIAERDLALRGPGEVLGTRQTGEMGFRIADLLRDQPMVPQVQRAADLVLARYPERVDPLIRRWVGEKSRYASV
jgi:ATP-dependent DNA helicase RecG